MQYVNQDTALCQDPYCQRKRCFCYQNVPKRYSDKYLNQAQTTLNQCSDHPHFVQIRKKLHQSKSQSFTLKQQLSKQRKQIIDLSQKNTSLQTQIKQNIEQLKFCDNQIKRYQYQSNEGKQYSFFLQQKVKSLQTKLTQTQQIIMDQKRYILNLKQQNDLLIQIKQVLSNQNNSLRSSYQDISSKYLTKQKQISKLTLQISHLIKGIQDLQDLVYNKNQEILSYQCFLNHKSHELQRKKRVQLKDQVVQQKIWGKLEKYKKKAFKYKQERNQLFRQIQQAKKEIGTITLRKYFTSDDTLQKDYC